MKVEIETYGCAMNQGDSEIMAGLLEKHGHKVVKKKGDVLLVNTCTVKTQTENKIRRRLRELEKGGYMVVVAGCMPAADTKIAEDFPGFSFIGVNSQDIVNAVNSELAGVRFVSIKKAGEKICTPKIRINPLIEIVPIAEGCLGACKYCLTKNARGSLRSFKPEDIERHVENAVSEGVKEIWITAQDTGAYGLDKSTNLPELLNRIVQLEGDFKIRVGMMNPNHALGFLDELLEVFKNEKIYRFIHLPVQSGSDKVLKEMGRKYNIEDFKLIATSFRKKLDATLSTDIIAGYPTETEQDFRQTLRLIEQTKPDIVNISRYWSRPGTSAADLKQHQGSLIKERSGRVSQLFKRIGLERNRKWIGWKGTCLASEKNPDGTFTIRNLWYKPIIVRTKKQILGKNVEVEVKDATSIDLRGVIKD